MLSPVDKNRLTGANRARSLRPGWQPGCFSDWQELQHETVHVGGEPNFAGGPGGGGGRHAGSGRTA
jgi:hypothetical protein